MYVFSKFPWFDKDHMLGTKHVTCSSHVKGYYPVISHNTTQYTNWEKSVVTKKGPCLYNKV